MSIDTNAVRAELDICPLTDRARDAVEELIAEVEGYHGITVEQIVLLVAHAMDSHETKSNCCHFTPGVDCWDWCPACKILDGLPAELLAAARALLVERER